jgi:lysozyme
MPNFGTVLPTGVSFNDKGLRSLLREFESFKEHAYPSPENDNTYTYGYGFKFDAQNRPVKQNAQISRQDAEALLTKKIIEHGSNVFKDQGFKKLNPNAQAAVLSFAFNVGPNFFGGNNFNTITKAIKSGDHYQVAKALLLYDEPGSSLHEGLKRRREAEARLALQPYASPVNSTLANNYSRKDGTKAVLKGKPVTWNAATKKWIPT